MQRHASCRTAGRLRANRRAVLLLLSGLFSFVASDAAPAAQERVADLSPRRDPVDAHVAEAARRFGIPATWIRAVMRRESGGDVRAVSPKGAMGLMQIMPATWAYLSDRHALGGDPYDPRANILAGAAYLRELHDRYGAPGFLAAYNAGPGRYEASRTGRPLPAETLRYVAALAPVLDEGADAGPVRLAAADPFAWTRSPLFAARSERSPMDAPMMAETESNGMPAAGAVRDVSVIVPQAGGLFVARRGGGEVR